MYRKVVTFYSRSAKIYQSRISPVITGENTTTFLGYRKTGRSFKKTGRWVEMAINGWSTRKTGRPGTPDTHQIS